tara:strand:+ start:511 stop:795 length:285 start_codon:yes stop_codon:yes gene_type:complete
MKRKKTVVLADGSIVEQEFTSEELAEFAEWDKESVNIQWFELRFKRNRLLTETDWMANSDVTMTDAWKTYRQALRDLPANTEDPANPTWPTKPE